MSNNYLINDKPLKVAINAQLTPQKTEGGVESILIGLVSALGNLTDSNEEYKIIVSSKEPDWLIPYLGPNQNLVIAPIGSNNKPGNKIPKLFRPYVKRFLKWGFDLIGSPNIIDAVPLSSGFYENLGCDLIHFPYQEFTLCSLPSVYNPHDLQHLHFPQFFPPNIIRRREQVYQAGCHYSNTVVVGSQWIKDDLIKQYGLYPDKIQVIPWGSPTEVLSDPTPELLHTVRSKYGLPEEYIYYPAMVWEHKNHIKLINSIAYLRDQKDIKINLVCTGNKDLPIWHRVEETINNLSLQTQVFFLGNIPFNELPSIYRLAEFVIIPSLFEAASGPVFEAWQYRKPVACSIVTSLPEQVGNAALLFDPNSVVSIADAILRLKFDRRLQEILINNGITRLENFSWERTAKAYRAVYRKVNNRLLTAEDNYLLKWDWMRNPQSEI